MPDMLLSDIFPCGEKHKGFVIGVEFEIEKVIYTDDFMKKYGSVCHSEIDHSLRDGGIEIITSPTNKEMACAIHADIQKLITFSDYSEAFSFRTSTHVHVNFQDVPVNKVKQFIFLYTLLEPYFFDLVEKSRKNNIFCVPLYSTTQTRKYKKSLNDLVVDGSGGDNGVRHQYWHKYAAFNILPLRTQGTIEFRHLEGTKDTAKLKKWLDVIEALYKFNLKHNIDFTRMSALSFVQEKLVELGFEYNPSHDAMLESIMLDILLALDPPDINKIMEKILEKEMK